MLQRFNGGDLGPESFQSCIFPSTSKLQSLQFPFRRNRVLLGFRLHKPTSGKRQHYPFPSTDQGPKLSLGFKAQCVPRPIGPSNKKNSSIFYKKDRRFVRDKEGERALPSILRYLENGCDIDKTLDLLGKDLSPKDQTVVLKSQRKVWEKVVRVFEFFYSQENYVPNVIHYNIVLRALGLAQKWDELRLRWIQMAKDGLLPTNHTYSVLVGVYGKAGFVKESLLWIKHMKLRGLFPDAILLNTVVSVLKDAQEFDRADKFYRNWCAGRVELDDLQLDSMEDFQDRSGSGPVSFKHFLSTELFKIGGRPPNSKISSPQDIKDSLKRPLPTSTYNTLIDLYGKAERLKDAADIFAEMLRDGAKIDTTTFNTMIHTCGTHGNLKEAEGLLSRMEINGPAPDTWTYTIFISLYADVEDIDAVLKWYRKIRKVGLLPNFVTYTTVLHILCKRSMVREVEAVIEEMDRFRVVLDEQSLPGIINMYVNEELLDKAKNLLERFDYCSSFSSKTRAAIMNSFAEKGLGSEAEFIFFRKSDSIDQKKDVIDYNVMLTAYGMAKLYDKAGSLFREMKNQGAWPDECTYRTMIQMYAKAGMVDRARQLLAEMQELGYDPQCLTFSCLIASYVRLKQSSEAVDLYKEMERAGVKPNEYVYGALINGFAETGEFELAVDYFHKMEESGIAPNKFVLTSLVKAYGNVGSLEGAKAVYQRMKLMEGGLDVVAQNAMINLFKDFGLASEAKLIFETLKNDGLADPYSFATMMHLYKTMLMIHEFNDIIEDFKGYDLAWNNVSFNQAMDCYVTIGQLQGCIELFREFVPKKLLPDNSTMKIFITVLRKANVPNEVVMQLQSAYEERQPRAMEAIVASASSAVGLDDYALQCCEKFLKGNDLDAFAYNVAIKAYEKAGKVNKALGVYLKMQDDGLEPDIVTYINLAACYGKARMVEGLKRIYGLLQSGEIEPNKLLFMAVCDGLKVARRHDLVYMVKKQMQIAYEDADKEGNDEYDDGYDYEYDAEYDDEYDDDDDDEESR